MQKQQPSQAQEAMTSHRSYDEILRDEYKKGMPKISQSEEKWKEILTPEQYTIARGAGTERPFCGTLLDNHKTGIYICVCCGLPLFSSNSKFNSGTGWPSFFKPFRKDHINEKSDVSFGMKRTEINCARCDAHLGHVFPDGPQPTGLRYCVNSESLSFVEENSNAKNNSSK